VEERSKRGEFTPRNEAENGLHRELRVADSQILNLYERTGFSTGVQENRYKELELPLTLIKYLIINTLRCLPGGPWVLGEKFRGKNVTSVP